MVWQAVHSGFDYFQREAGYTRTGGPSHGGRQREGRPSAVGNGNRREFQALCI